MSEIQIFAFGFPPKNWLQCAGQTLAISQNQALFSLLGTTFGGDGITNFLIPDLRGRTANSFGQAAGGSQFFLGQKSGEELHTLSLGEMPPHNHTWMAGTTTADQVNADGNMLASAGSAGIFIGSKDATIMAGNTIGTGGNGQGHANIQPYLVMNYCICQFGLYPSRS